MHRHHRDGRIRVGVATAVVLVVGLLVGSTTASAAPRDNIANAGKCLQGGWRTLQPRADRSFNSLAGCVIFALFGGTFYVQQQQQPPPQQQQPPQPPPVGGQ